MKKILLSTLLLITSFNVSHAVPETVGPPESWQDLEQVSVCPKFPNYYLLAGGILMAALSVPFFIDPENITSSKKGSYFCGGFLGLFSCGCIGNQISNFINRKKPILILTSEGIWYNGLFQKNQLYHWHEISRIRIETRRASILTLYAKGRKNLAIVLDNLAIKKDDLKGHIERFSGFHFL